MTRMVGPADSDGASWPPVFRHRLHLKATVSDAGVSSGTLAVERPFDMHRFRALFPDRWQAFLKAHFRNSAEIAHFFDVDDKTARNWLEGSTKPTAPTAIIAIARIPGALAELIGVAA